MNKEIINGARTFAEFHPSAEPDVKAKMNKMNPKVRMEIPMMSTRFILENCVSFFDSSAPAVGMRNVVRSEMGIARHEFNQKIHGQLANWTNRAPMITPRT